MSRAAPQREEKKRAPRVPPYEVLPVEDFGRQLLASGDLDPVYVALHRMRESEHLDAEQLQRWLVAYWCCYHVGASCWLSQHAGRGFWQALLLAARNQEAAPTGGRWPRAAERRHWRGEAAERCVHDLATQYPNGPQHLVSYIISTSVWPMPFAELRQRVKRHHLFGDWIAFKVGDMLDRVLETPVDFSRASVFMYRDPAEAALMVWRAKMQLPDSARPKNRQAALDGVVDYLLDVFKDYKAPPRMDRPVGLQEVETILCCWKSHVRGHYPLFNDIDEIREGLEPWLPHSLTARQFLAAMPEGSR